jgi:hypothetical protein
MYLVDLVVFLLCLLVKEKRCLKSAGCILSSSEIIAGF